MLQLHPELNLIDARLLQLHLKMSKRPAPVHRLHVLAPVQKPRRLPAADTGGGTLGALCDNSAQTNHEYLDSPGAESGAQNRGEACGREGVEGGDTEEENGEDGGEDGEEDYNEWSSTCNYSSVIRASSTREYEPLTEGAEIPNSMEDNRGWTTVAWCRRRPGGRKARAWGKGGGRQGTEQGGGTDGERQQATTGRQRWRRQGEDPTNGAAAGGGRRAAGGGRQAVGLGRGPEAGGRGRRRSLLSLSDPLS